MEHEESLASTPSWAVATVVAGLITLSLLLEHSLHVVSRLVEKSKRKSLNQAVYQFKSALRSLGFITLLLTIAYHPVSKICIPENFTNAFHPCSDDSFSSSDAQIGENESCAEGMVPLLSREGTNQLQVLILMLAVNFVICFLVTMGLGEMKLKKWELWEEETNTLDHRLSSDNRRFCLTKETSFGRRHLRYWSENPVLLWIACFLRQLTGSVSKADYFTLRNGFIDAHLCKNTNFNFHKLLRRSLDKDFKVLLTISLPIWTYVILSILFKAHIFRNRLWLEFIPLLVLFVVGAKLEAIIIEMCLKSSKETVVVTGELKVHPNDNLFWFGKPQLILYAIQFILIENSFKLAFLMWDLYTFGYKSCFHSTFAELAVNLVTSFLVQFICSYMTLPLYALVSQMGSSMKKTIFAEQVLAGLKNWRTNARRSLYGKEYITTLSSYRSSGVFSKVFSGASVTTLSTSRSPSPRKQSDGRRASSWITSPSSSSPRLRSGTLPSFEFPTQRRELEQIQKLTEEMIGPNRNSSVGEVSFRMWWKQEITRDLPA
ncbi:hypothetical protein HPP92_008827 [Vanilla planifolia]|uniref:MLO-like protein n=1 Tax=Vanilla planifolia TaxID=51239 RepID=A0A835V4V4_VANPL|nr:hypothetical protein HPP92_008827 [Vanilla planifolia]